ncbi:MAG: hypothetical protein IKZ86_10125 [Spirochaetaceae bacterium]|nr:hypothetical protein [Spirochaetaceae bacterium]
MRCFHAESELKRYRKVGERYSKWMKEHWALGAKDKFEWTDENVRRILALNDAIIQKENSLYRLLSNVKADIENLLASGKDYYKYYDIDAYLSYEADDYATPTGDEDTMSDVYFVTNFEFCMGIHTSADKPLLPVEEEFDRSTNFNYDGMFKDIPDKKHFITRSLHRLMEEETYTLEDLLWLNPDNFVECIEIRN